jgi:hypothetical protein
MPKRNPDGAIGESLHFLKWLLLQYGYSIVP